MPQADSAVLSTTLVSELTLSERPGRVWSGRIVRSAGAIDPKTRTLRIEVDVDNADASLLDGSYAEVHLGNTSQSLPRLPVNAILFGTEGPRVAVVDKESKVHLSKVRIGRDLGTELEITEGVLGNESIIINPPDGIRDGSSVQVLAPANAPPKSTT